jgi:hypothetical protein
MAMKDFLELAGGFLIPGLAMILVLFLVYLFVLGPYVSCFSQPIPSWSHVGHFERCILGVRPGWFDEKNVWHDE